MDIKQLKEIALNGQLTVFKKVYRARTRRQFIWNKDYSEILDEKTIPYTVYYYGARCEWQAQHESYKITKADYKELEAIINNPDVKGE